jgi:phospholipid/cholesterol/gamma-HCH transport system substrate-binding protein
MLKAVRRLGDTASRVINASQADLVANLRNLQPTLDRLGRVGTAIPKTLSVILTYPTADTVEQEYFGDYGNLALTLDVSAKSLLQTFGPQLSSLFPDVKRRHRHRAGSGSGSLPTPTTPSLPNGLTRWAPGTDISGLLLGAMS